MLLYMIRHGESETNKAGVNGGCHLPINLTEKGIEEAKEAGKTIAGIKFDKIYSSTLKRAIQTCKVALPGCEPILNENLREFDVGNVEGVRTLECQQKYGDAWFEAVRQHDFTAFGGETRHTHRERLKKFLEILEKEPCDNIAAFAHEGTIRRMYEIAMDTDECTDIRCKNGGVYVFEFDGEKWLLKKWEL